MPVHMVASPRKTPRATTPRVADAPAPASPQFGGPKSAPPAVFRTCSNCGKSDILAANIVLHEAHCCRHYRRCEYCSVLLEVRAVDAHVAEMRGTLETLVQMCQKAASSMALLTLEGESQLCAGEFWLSLALLGLFHGL